MLNEKALHPERLTNCEPIIANRRGLPRSGGASANWYDALLIAIVSAA
ncbi:hypothetical protein [Pleurocapsa sp. PCC 7327]|nr:hypothetical protein [Pleurocapsa sp. PCC 7327]